MMQGVRGAEGVLSNSSRAAFGHDPAGVVVEKKHVRLFKSRN